MKRKGVSPLIATVLIIGFTVALAAVIMTWGQSFIKSMQERTAESAEAQLICTENVGLELRVCNKTYNWEGIIGEKSSVFIVLENTKTQKLENISMRVTRTGTAPHVYIDSGLDGLSISARPYTALYLEVSDRIITVEAIPLIKVEGQDELVTCQAFVAKLDLRNAKREASGFLKLDLC